MPHYTIYLFAGNILFNYFRESTIGGMQALVNNAAIFSKVKVPKYIFVLTKNVSALINFGLTLIIFFIFVLIDDISISWNIFSLIIPILCLVVFNLGIGMILSALFIFFRDMSYLYDVFWNLLMYMSAIFYSVDTFAPNFQKLFLLNPIYCYIKFFRVVVIDGSIPSLLFMLLCVLYAVLAICVGSIIYKKCNNKFLYYI